MAFLAAKPVNKAYLFGSYVRGEAKKGSDVDILGLVEMDLIRIKEVEDPGNCFSALLAKYRKKIEKAPKLEKIAKDVDLVRSQRKHYNG